MSSVSFRGTSAAIPEPVISVATKKSGPNSVTEQSFGKSLSKALPAKTEKANTPPPEKTNEKSPEIGGAEVPTTKEGVKLTIQGQATINETPVPLKPALLVNPEVPVKPALLVERDAPVKADDFVKNNVPATPGVQDGSVKPKGNPVNLKIETIKLQLETVDQKVAPQKTKIYNLNDSQLAPDTDTASDALAPVMMPSQVIPEQQVTIPTTYIPGLTTPSENAKPFTPADNSVGASVLASIQMAKAMGNRAPGLLNPTLKEAPKDIASVAVKVSQEVISAATSTTPLEKTVTIISPVEPKRVQQTSATLVLALAPGPTPALTPDVALDVAPKVTAPTLSEAQIASQASATTQNKLGISTTIDANPLSSIQAPTQTRLQVQSPIQPAAPATLTAQLSTAEWNKGLGQQLVNMSLRGNQTMELHLHPQDLGPISINLKVNEMAQAQAQFFSQNAQVRSAIEQALPQLKEAMAEQGISLGQSSVSDQRQQPAPREPQGNPISSSNISATLGLVDASIAKSTENQQIDGQISTYA